MFEQSLIEKIRTDTYLGEIFKASDGNPNISLIAVDLIKTIKEIYRFFEPSHFTGELLICSSPNSSVISMTKPEKIQYDKNALASLRSKKLFIQKINDELFLCKNVDVKSLTNNKNILFYYFKKNNEYFVINNKIINVNPVPECASIFSLYYLELKEALDHYSTEKISTSLCEHFRTVWADKKRIYFKNKPEEIMRKSLKEHLSSALRGVEISPEFTLNAVKPVDIRVRWKTSNRSALIEIKWLGVSLNETNNKKATEYTNCRATSGAKQLKEYLDLVASDTPTTITNGYLLVIDGRRKGISKKIIKVISENDGLYYQSEELSFPDEYNYSDFVYNFEKPIRMFARPIFQ